MLAAEHGLDGKCNHTLLLGTVQLRWMDSPPREVTLTRKHLPPFSKGATLKGKIYSHCSWEQILPFSFKSSTFWKGIHMQGSKFFFLLEWSSFRKGGKNLQFRFFFVLDPLIHFTLNYEERAFIAYGSRWAERSNNTTRAFAVFGYIDIIWWFSVQKMTKWRPWSDSTVQLQGWSRLWSSTYAINIHYPWFDYLFTVFVVFFFILCAFQMPVSNIGCRQFSIKIFHE